MSCQVSELKLQEVVNEIKKIRAVNEICLFGSRARKTHKPTSDYDIMVFCNPFIPISDKTYQRIFKLPKKFDIKFIDDKRYYGDTMWVYDRYDWTEQGTPISSEILEDMKSLWKRKR